MAELLSALTLAGCWGETRLVMPSPEATGHVGTPSIPTSILPATAEAGPSLGEVVWATAVDAVTQAPTERVSSFATDAPSIFACLLATDLDPGSTIDASWSYNHTSLDAFATQLTLPDAARHRWIAFHIDRDPNVFWPEGTYAISVTLNGTIAREAAVEVTSAD
jgi:hypothetical protein